MSAPSFTLALAPMQGVIDAMMREQLTALGGIDHCVSEFIRVGGIPVTDAVILKAWREAPRKGFTSSGTPVHPQLLGSHLGRMTVAAHRLAELGAPWIDLNFGCPVRKVNGHDGGAAILRNPRRVEQIVATVRKTLPSSIPVSAKIRLGWDDPDHVVDLARAAEAGGAALVTIHGRTRAQGFDDTADWIRIGKARAALAVPVVANGDIRSPDDFLRCREVTGCDRFMIGRGAIERPELFRVLRGIDDAMWSWHKRMALVLRLIQQRHAWGERPLNSLGRLKGWCQSMVRCEPAMRGLFEELKSCSTLESAYAAVERHLPPEVAHLPPMVTSWPCSQTQGDDRWNSQR
ncbi:MAG: tRNA-dihydrouridine synthase family protein [Deltaproteobacteria bacterium]|nr:tRNA-dihydrouridine synthase family protein [Deltaproteobacteria bacterium]